MAMKGLCLTGILLCAAVFANASSHDAKGEDRTITKVVKLLQRILDKSKEDAESDNILYSKYQCFADSFVADKSTSIKQLTADTEILENKIAELQAKNGELSVQVQLLNKDVTANRATDASATAVRGTSNKAFIGMEADLVTAIGQMKEALKVLKSLALSQTGAEFLAGSRSAKVQNVLTSKDRDALVAVSALLPSKNRDAMESFLQAEPEKAKGNAIVGVLQNLMTTFEFNLGSARDTEKAELKAFEATVATLQSSRETMEKLLKTKESDMGANDGELSSKKTSFDTATKQKANDEDLLENLKEQAATKAKNYEERKMLRTNEDAAVSQAISILNSDASFSAFGRTDATSTGKAQASFLQLRHRGGVSWSKAAQALEQAHSSRLSVVEAALLAGNPFEKVIAQIENMKKTITDEATADKEKKSWCDTERATSKKDSEAKGRQVTELNGKADQLETTIGSSDEPMTGLRKEMADMQTSLLQNQNSQTETTKMRKEEHGKFQVDARNLAEAEDTLDRALKVLAKYYAALDKKLAAESASFLQESSWTATWMQTSDPDQSGMASLGSQSKSGGSAIQTLEFILGETKKERAKAASDEVTAKSAFDKQIAKDKEDETSLHQSLVALSESLTSNQKQLQETSSDLKDTTGAKEAIDNYLLKIKPGCDFIVTNFNLREDKRGKEMQALENAIGLIKGSPVFKAAK